MPRHEGFVSTVQNNFLTKRKSQIEIGLNKAWKLFGCLAVLGHLGKQDRLI